jgi:hypothetical protein
MSSTGPHRRDAAREPIRTATRRFHDDIQQALGARHARGARHEAIEDTVKLGGTRVWRAMKRHPFLTMAALGVCGVAAASAIGVGELVVGSVLAFAAYKVLREGEPPLQALEEAEREVLG